MGWVLIRDERSFLHVYYKIIAFKRMNLEIAHNLVLTVIKSVS